MNDRITKKERGLLKGAIRRVFSRSDLRKSVVEASVIPGYSDPARPRVKKWSRCALCKTPTPTYQAQVDHVDPIVPIDVSFEDMSIDTVVDRAWCDIKFLQVACLPCHSCKTLSENALRRKSKKERKK